MNISKESLQEFKEIYKKETDKELSEKEAKEYSTDILNLVELTIRQRNDRISKIVIK